MSNITFTSSGNELTIKLYGRIDSTNAAAVEAEALAIDSLSEYGGVTLDMDELEYISSAGLRIILKLRKRNNGLKIINAPSEIYDILDMTGFTEMIPVQRAYRKLSVDGCEVIGQGANGKVYRLDGDTIIKVYMNPDSLEDIQKERELARRAFVLGIPTAIPYDVVKVGNSYGSVFELLNARSFAKILAAEPNRLDEIAVLYVDLLKKIHGTKVNEGELTDIKPVVRGWVSTLSGFIPDDKLDKLRGLIEDIPESLNMIHGDYHVKNVMMQDGEVLLIDMDTLAHGDPVFEFAFIYNTYKGFTALNHSTLEKFIGIPYELGVKLWNKTLQLYFGTDDSKQLKSVEDKAALIAFVRQLRRNVHRELYKTPDGKKAFDFYREQLLTTLDSVNSLIL